MSKTQNLWLTFSHHENCSDFACFGRQFWTTVLPAQISGPFFAGKVISRNPLSKEGVVLVLVSPFAEVPAHSIWYGAKDLPICWHVTNPLEDSPKTKRCFFLSFGIPLQGTKISHLWRREITDSTVFWEGIWTRSPSSQEGFFGVIHG